MALEFAVDLPAGGQMHLQSAEEMSLWEKAHERYSEDYGFLKMNDLVSLGNLLQNQVLLFRIQLQINEMVPEFDKWGAPTGKYVKKELKPDEVEKLQRQMSSITGQISSLEKTLGIDKSTREAGGAHTVDNYLREAKRAAYQQGIHISKRVLEYERVMNELKMRLRILYNADDEDRKYHNISPKTIIEWLKDECTKFEALDKKYAAEKGKLFAGKL